MADYSGNQKLCATCVYWIAQRDVDLYNTWSSYGVETEGVMIAYTSVYGNTKKAVELLAAELVNYGCQQVIVTDLARSDMSEAVEDAFRYGKLVLATTTYNGSIFPFMREFLADLAERNFQNRTVAYIENGSWAPFATKKMQDALSGCKNLKECQTTVKIVSSLTEENVLEIKALAKELCQ
jgi:flavorubredoxin